MRVVFFFEMGGLGEDKVCCWFDNKKYYCFVIRIVIVGGEKNLVIENII